MEKKRIYDKINYQTNFTSPSTYAILLKATKEEKTVESEYARDVLFPKARSNAGMNWNPQNRDTHGEISLAQFSLIDYIDESHFCLSLLGEKFLELFDEKFIMKNDNQYNFISVMVETILSWIDKKNGRYINVGEILFRLLLDDKINCYITANEWSYVCEGSNIKTIDEYSRIVEELYEKIGSDVTNYNRVSVI